MIWFDPMWIHLLLFIKIIWFDDQIWSNKNAFYQTGFFKMIWFDPTWSNVNIFIAFYQNCFSKMTWFDPMWIHLLLFIKIIWFDRIWSNVNPIIAFYQNCFFKMIWFDPMWIHLLLFQNNVIWSNMNPFTYVLLFIKISTTFIATDLNAVFFSFPPINSFAPDPEIYI